MSVAETASRISEAVLQKSLQDLIKGIRSSRDQHSEYISKGIADCKVELRNTDPDLKAEAVSWPILENFDASSIPEARAMVRFP